MDENNKVFFIINKFSGSSYRPSVEGQIKTRCRKLNLAFGIEFTRGRGHATELARAAADQGFRKVYAVGGDGTVNEVAQGLLNTGTAMGILPKGSGNGLARHLKIPMNFSKALALIGVSQPIMMDTFTVNHELSVNVSGIGFDGHVAGLFDKRSKRGFIGYGRLVMKEFLRFREFPVKIELDGKKMERKSFIVALANSSQFGNNARIAPHASVCDQLIDVCFIRKVPVVQAAGFAQKMFRGKMNKSAFVEILQGKNLKIELEKPVAFHIDGEPRPPATRFHISMAPSSLCMMVPFNLKKGI